MRPINLEPKNTSINFQDVKEGEDVAPTADNFITKDGLYRRVLSTKINTYHGTSQQVVIERKSCEIVEDYLSRVRLEKPCFEGFYRIYYDIEDIVALQPYIN